MVVSLQILPLHPVRWAALALAVAVVGCAPATIRPPAQAAPGQSERLDGTRSVRKTLRIAEDDVPTALNNRFGESVAGGILNASLAYRDEADVPRPLLAQRLPSQSEGTWTVNADGTMQTVYALKPDLKWQDGHPLGAADFVLAYKVYTDPAIAVRTRLPESLMSDVILRDDRTIEIIWAQKYVEADALTDRALRPVPVHLLGDLYSRDKEAFSNSSFWSSEDYIGAGPYRVTKWERGATMTLAANPHFVMGKPKIETVEILFVTDLNATTAALLAGSLDYAEYHAIDIQQALILKRQWTEGQIFANEAGARYLEFQHREVPNHNRVVTDVRVRRALMHALDREALAEIRTGGLGAAADTGHPRTTPIYPRLDPVISRYPFDVRRTQAVLAEAGWTKAPDGVFRDSSGRSLDVSIWGSEEEEQEITIIADDWKRAGINSGLFVMSRTQRSDFELRVSFPGATASSGRDPIAHDRTLWENAPTPQNRFRGPNRGSYNNAEADRLYYLAKQSLDSAERLNVLLELERVFTADVGTGMLFYIVRPAAARHEVKGIKPAGFNYNDFTHFWNVWEWTLE